MEKQQFQFHRFNPIGAQTHDLPHQRRCKRISLNLNYFFIHLTRIAESQWLQAVLTVSVV
jgi:hypothetical protein